MENCQKRHAYSKRRPRATPWSARPRFCLTVFGHQGDSISTLTKRKAQMTLPQLNHCAGAPIRNDTCHFGIACEEVWRHAFAVANNESR